MEKCLGDENICYSPNPKEKMYRVLREIRVRILRRLKKATIHLRTLGFMPSRYTKITGFLKTYFCITVKFLQNLTKNIIYSVQKLKSRYF